MLNKVTGLLKSSRFLKSVASAALICVVAKSLSYSILILFFLLFSYLYNDHTDYEEDKLAHPDRPLQRGLVSRCEVLVAAMLILIFGAIFVYLELKEYILFYLGLIAFSATYSMYLKKAIPSIATSVWSFVVTVVILLPVGFGFWEYLLIFTFFNARELLLDYIDKDADDKFCKTKSLPSLIGDYFFLLIFILIFISFSASVLMGEWLVSAFTFIALAGFLVCYKNGFDKISLTYFINLQVILFAGVLLL